MIWWSFMLEVQLVPDLAGSRPFANLLIMLISAGPSGKNIVWVYQEAFFWMPTRAWYCLVQEARCVNNFPIFMLGDASCDIWSSLISRLYNISVIRLNHFKPNIAWPHLCLFTQQWSTIICSQVKLFLQSQIICLSNTTCIRLLLWVSTSGRMYSGPSILRPLTGPRKFGLILLVVLK